MSLIHERNGQDFESALAEMGIEDMELDIDSSLQSRTKSVPKDEDDNPTLESTGGSFELDELKSTIRQREKQIRDMAQEIKGADQEFVAIVERVTGRSYASFPSKKAAEDALRRAGGGEYLMYRDVMRQNPHYTPTQNNARMIEKWLILNDGLKPNQVPTVAQVNRAIADLSVMNVLERNDPAQEQATQQQVDEMMRQRGKVPKSDSHLLDGEM